MSQRELTFYPETERTRDLIYSEYTSCDRSIHCLLQDNTTAQHGFLLGAYREIVSRYLSGARLQSPEAFLKNLVGRLEELARPYHFSMEDYQSMGFHLLLRSTDAYYLLTSRRETVFVHDDGDVVPLSESGLPGVDWMNMDSGQLQEELFPEGLTDCFALYSFDPARYAEKDIILGCSEEDRSTVLEVLGDPLWLRSGERRNSFSSRFITHKVLVLRFEDRRAAVATSGRIFSRGHTSWRRVAIMLAGGAAVVALVTTLVKTDTLMPWKQERGTAMMERPVTETREMTTGASGADGQIVAESAVTTDADGASMLDTRLVESWARKFPQPVTSSPALRADRVYFGCRDGNLYALDAASGKTIWKVSTSGGVGASPALGEDLVVAADYGGNVFAVSQADGKRLWKTKLPNRVVSSPVLTSDRLMVGCYDGNAYCLSLIDGNTLWKHGTGAKIRASAGTSDEAFIAASYDGNVYALSHADGTLRWKYRIGGNIAGSPVVADGTVVIGGPDGAVYALSASDGTLRWKFRTAGSVKSTPTIESGLVFLGSNDRHIYCLRLENGVEVWKHKTGGVVLTRPVVRDGVVYAGSYDGYLYCLGTEDGALVDRFQSDGEIYSSPAAAENAIYFGNNKGRFIALGHTTKDAS